MSEIGCAPVPKRLDVDHATFRFHDGQLWIEGNDEPVTFLSLVMLDRMISAALKQKRATMLRETVRTGKRPGPWP